MLGVRQGLPAEQESIFILQGFEPRIVQAVAYSHPVQLLMFRGLLCASAYWVLILYEPPEEGRAQWSKHVAVKHILN
jgi:hypothetical protein